MLALKIISTIFVTLSWFTSTAKNESFLEDNPEINFTGMELIMLLMYSVLWRALVIVTIWVA